jgi:chromosomal replication initiator protein
MILCKPCVEHPLESPIIDLTHFEIIRKVCEFMNVKESQVLSKSREYKMVMTRFVIIDCLLNQQSFKYTLKEIGQMLGGRDHTTIIHSRDALKNWVSTDETMRNVLKNAHLQVFNSLRYFNY